MFELRPLWFFFFLIGLHVIESSVYVLRNVPFSVVVESFEDAVSRFGIELFHLDGFLTVADPINACKPISPRPATSATFTSDSSSTDKLTNLPYIALIERGECDFDLKVFNAQTANYSGVIVYNTVPNEIFPMGGKKYIKDIFIPAVMVNKAAGDKLRTYAVSESRKDFVISMVSFYSLPLKYVLLSLLVLVGVALIFLIVCFAAHLCNLWRRMRRGRLSRRHLRRLQTKRFEKARDPYETCPICLDDYKEREKLRLLPCHHAFHTRCIDPWLLRNRRRCPVCNQTVELPGAPAPEDVVGVHDPIQRTSFRTRLRRIRLLFVRHSSVTRRDPTEWNSSADSSLVSANSPVPNEQDEERAPLLAQNRSPQTSRYNTNPAYLRQLVTGDETSEQPPLLDIIVSPGSSNTQVVEDEELLRVHVDDPARFSKTFATVSTSSLPCTEIVPSDRFEDRNNEHPNSTEDEQLLSDVGKSTVAIS